MPILDVYGSLVGSQTIRRIRQFQADLMTRPAEPESASLYLHLEFSEEMAESLASPMTPLGGVHGVGIWGLDEGEPTPAIFLMGRPDMDEVSEVSLEDDYRFAGLVEARLGIVPRDFVGVVLPPLQPHADIGPGVDIRAMGVPGGLGLPVWTKNGNRGITTAGHVATSIGAPVQVGDETVGYVEDTDSTDRHPRGVECADIAIVVLRSSCRDIPVTLAGIRNGSDYDLLESWTPSGQHRGWVRGCSEQLADRVNNGVWADVLIANEAISSPGDSGSLVTDGAGYALGHVIGGAVPAFSVIQDVNYQLTKMGVRPRLPIEDMGDDLS